MLLPSQVEVSDNLPLVDISEDHLAIVRNRSEEACLLRVSHCSHVVVVVVHRVERVDLSTAIGSDSFI